jgi:hypothetical protein
MERWCGERPPEASLEPSTTPQKNTDALEKGWNAHCRRHQHASCRSVRRGAPRAMDEHCRRHQHPSCCASALLLRCPPGLVSSVSLVDAVEEAQLPELLRLRGPARTRRDRGTGRRGASSAASAVARARHIECRVLAGRAGGPARLHRNQTRMHCTA